MIIDYTPEEIAQARQLRERIAPSLANFNSLIAQETEKAKRDELIIQRQAAIDRNEAEITAFIKQCEKKRFSVIEAGGAPAILDSAREQLPRLIRLFYEETKRDTAGLENKVLKNACVGTRRKDEFFINPDYMAGYLKEELELHIEALREEKDHAQQLFALINEAIINSPLTDKKPSAKKHTGKSPLAQALGLRRGPLAEIKSFGLMTDKTSAALIEDEGSIFTQKADGQIAIRWITNQAPEKAPAVPVYIALSYEGTSEGRQKLTAFDQAVYNAISTRFYLWKKENPGEALQITPAEIWRNMNGKQAGDTAAKPSAAQIKKVCASIDKMASMRFYMDIREEIAAFNLKIDDERFSNGYIRDNFLNCREIGFISDRGRIVNSYQIREEPALYTYNRFKKHMAIIPFEMLDTSNEISSSEDVIAFKNYLLQQIQLMKKAKEESNGKRRFKRNTRILLSTVYTKTGTPAPEQRTEGKSFKDEETRQAMIRRYRKTDREKVEKLLTAWKAKAWIYDFTPVMRGPSVIGWDIILEKA